MTIRVPQTSIETVPTGEYPAVIADIEEAEGAFGPQIKFLFELPETEDGERRTLLGWCSRKFNQKTKLYSWTSAAFGGSEIDKDYEFCSDDLLCKMVSLTIVIEDGEKGEYNKITGVRPYTRKAKKQQQQSPPEPDPVDDDHLW